MSWCFGVVNNKLAEVYFENEGGNLRFHSHCYVKKSEYKTKTELKWIDKDIKRIVLTYRKGKYLKKIY